MFEILWILIAFLIIFLFLGGVLGFILALIVFLFKENSKFFFILGLLISGGYSFWLSREVLQLSYFDTVSAVIISLLTYIFSLLILKKYLIKPKAVGKIGK